MMKPMRLALCCALVLSACVATVTKDKPHGMVVADLIRQKMAKQPGVQIVNTAEVLTRKQLVGITDPLIRTRSEKTKGYSLLYVAQRNGDAQIWKSPDNVSFTMIDGIITQTRGLDGDLYAADVAQLRAALANRSGAQSVQRINRRLDGSNAVVSIRLDCTLSDLGSESVEVLTLRYTARHFQETCRSEEESFTNDYWIDTKGIMRASRQWIGPGFETIYLERLTD